MRGVRCAVNVGGMYSWETRSQGGGHDTQGTRGGHWEGMRVDSQACALQPLGIGMALTFTVLVEKVMFPDNSFLQAQVTWRLL